jgi:membrane protein
MAKLAASWRRFAQLYRKEIWQPAYLNDTSWRGRLYALLRIISISITVFRETKAASRAAALSFSSLLGLGPLVAIAMLVAGMVLNQKDPDLAVNTMNRMIKFIAPQVDQYESLSNQPGSRHWSRDGGSTGAQTDVAKSIAPSPTLLGGSGSDLNSGKSPSPAKPVPSADDGAAARRDYYRTHPQMERMLNGFVTGSRSSTAGAVGALTLILIVILLFKTIEDAFNEIWGVREGRSWLMRIIYYWTILTLGAVLFFASVTLLGAGAFINVFIGGLPYGHELLTLLRWLLPVGSGLLVVGMLTLFYRYIPNTRVYWRAAFVGAVIVALLLLANNFLAFIYVRRVVISRSLYGSLGIMPILMFGLFVFWLYVLIGGQISYAVQNVHFRSSQNAWSTLSAAARERLSLIVLLTVGRRFQDCLPPCGPSQLSDVIKVPTQILNECLNRLVDMQLLTPIPASDSDPTGDLLFQPARPLNRITLKEFKRRFENCGEDLAGETIEALDPLVQHYHQALDAGTSTEFLQKSLDQLFMDHAFDRSHPPFAFGPESRPS